jgi:hypothetical protein
LSAAHSTHTARDDELPGKIAAELPVGHRGECLERSLNNSLCSDVDPTAGSHLAVHHETATFKFVKVFPVGPRAHKV